MDSWGYSDTLLSYFILLWKSYVTTVSSGTSMGIALGFAMALVVAVFIILVTFSLVRRLFRFRKFRIKQMVRILRGRRMSITDQEEYEKVLISDGITDVLDELFLLGKITAEKRKWWAVRIGQKLDLQDLLRDNEASKKEQIKRRLHKEYGITVEAVKPEVVEDPKPKKFGSGKLFKAA